MHAAISFHKAARNFIAETVGTQQNHITLPETKPDHVRRTICRIDADAPQYDIALVMNQGILFAQTSGIDE